MATQTYEGPATVVFSSEELLIIWQYLTRISSQDTEEIRRRIKNYLEQRD